MKKTTKRKTVKKAPKLYTQAQMDAACTEACQLGFRAVKQAEQVMTLSDQLKQQVINVRGELEKIKKTLGEETQKALAALTALESIGAPGLDHPLFDAYISHVALKMGALAYIPPEKRKKT